jgi:hypothetical protein
MKINFYFYFLNFEEKIKNFKKLKKINKKIKNFIIFFNLPDFLIAKKLYYIKIFKMGTCNSNTKKSVGENNLTTYRGTESNLKTSPSK